MGLPRNGTKPHFLRSGKVSIKVLRPPPIVIVNGRRVAGEPSGHCIEGNIQPMGFRQLMLVKEADRNKEWYYIMADLDQDIREADERGRWEADIIVWGDKHFQVMKVARWEMGVLDHQTIMAARVPYTGGYDG